MRWSELAVSKLTRVRETRLRMAEVALARADGEVATSRAIESQARAALAEASERCVVEMGLANQAVLEHATGGRLGVSQWREARRRALIPVDVQRRTLEDAVSSRLEQELALSAARSKWREMRAKLERMRLLRERQGEVAP